MRPCLTHTDPVLPCYFEAPGTQLSPLLGPTSSLKYRNIPGRTNNPLQDLLRDALTQEAVKGPL